MKFDIPDGFVVIPLNATGTPTGIALWCETPDQCEEVFNQEHGGEGNAYLVSCWRSSEVSRKGPSGSVVKLEKPSHRHRVEDE